MMLTGSQKNWGCNLDAYDKRIKLENALRKVETKLRMRCHMSWCDNPRACPENCECRKSSSKPVKLDLNTAIVWSTAEAVQRLNYSFGDCFTTSKCIHNSAVEIAEEVAIMCHILRFHSSKYVKDAAMVDAASNLVSYIECMYTHGHMSDPAYMRFFDEEFTRFKEI